MRINPGISLRIAIILTIFLFPLVTIYGNTFFYNDELDMLAQAKEVSMENILAPQNEHFKPLFKLFYFSEYKLFGFEHNFFFLTHIILHTMALILTGLILDKLTKRHILTGVVILIAGTGGIYNEVMFWTMSSCIILNTIFVLGSILVFLHYLDKGKYIWLILSSFFAFLSQFTFGTSLFFPLIYLFFPTVECLKKKRLDLKIISQYIPFLILNIIYLILFTHFVNLSNSDFTLDFKSLMMITTYSFYGIGGVLNFTILPGTKINIIILIFCFTFLSTLIFSVFKYIKGNPRFRVVLFFLLNILLIYSTIAPSRIQLGLGQSLSSRYTYLPFLLFAISSGIIIKELQLKGIKRLKISIHIIPYCVALYLLLANASFLYYISKNYWSPLHKGNKNYIENLKKNDLNPEETAPRRIYDPGIKNKKLQEIFYSE